MIDPFARQISPMPDAAPPGSGYVELHCASAFSFLRAGSSVETLVARASALGLPALALTDYMTLAGVVRFQAACERHGVRPILGAELAVTDSVFGDAATPAHLVVLARNLDGYAQLCRLLTATNLRTIRPPTVPAVSFAELVSAVTHGNLLVLTGGRQGTITRLLLAGKRQAAMEVAQRYARDFGPTCCWVELQHHRLPDDGWLMQSLVGLAEEVGLPVLATNGVRYASRDDYHLYDLLTCVRLRTTVDQPHVERPQNDEACLKGPEEMLEFFSSYPWGRAALAASAEIAASCAVSLLKPTCIPPQVSLPEGETATTRLRTLCEAGLRTRYKQEPAALLPDSPQRLQIERELQVIAKLELEEFFLCVEDIVRHARAIGIRCSGRGSAANSIVAYLLHITGVDPLRHKLLFERFLTPDRRGMPDIDVDIQSDRRDEVIRYVEQTYTPEHAAMVANISTYRARGALRDTAKALGYPLDVVSKLTKVLPHHCGYEELFTYADELAQTLHTALPKESDAHMRAQCLARLPVLLALTPRLCGLPRHLSLHNGGMVLARQPLTDLLPVRLSTNGVRALEINKDDVERLGLIKLDLLGLRVLSAVEETAELIEQTTGERLDVDALTLDPPDPATMRLIRAGQTLAVFQIESPGQWHLLAQTQPETFDDLVVQTALFRPGPIQSNMVHPYIARRQRQRNAVPERPQRDAVQTPWHGEPADDFWTNHPVLGPILADSEGILLFQEQILEIAHAYAGLTYAEADGFRRAMSHVRSPAEMEAMRERFERGARAAGESPEDITRVFDAIAKFVGYGFCKSHAAEFARAIYQTAYLKAHWPAHYLAAFLNAQPGGFFPPHVVLHEARLLGIPLLPVDINRSEDRFSVERVGQSRQRPQGRWAIRIGLRQVAHVGDELAASILWARRGNMLSGDPERPFISLNDLCHRLRLTGLTWRAAESLVLSGACDGLAPRADRRQRLWQLHQLWPIVGTARLGGDGRQKRRHGREASAEQLTFDWLEGVADDAEQIPRLADIPALPTLTGEERLALDYRLLGMSTRPHPMRLLRDRLRRSGVRAITDLADVAEGQVVHVAGWPISAQRPPTAKGMGFLVLEDEGGRLPVAVPPKLADVMYRRVREARAVVVAGRVERVRWYRSMLAYDLQPISA